MAGTVSAKNTRAYLGCNNTNMKYIKLLVIAASGLSACFAQVPTNAGKASPAPEQKGVANPAAALTGIKELPLVNPGNEQIMWDGKTWSMENNRLLGARFEKYLTEPEDQTSDFAAYSKLLSDITELVTPNPYKRQDADWMAQAFAKLQSASQFPADAGISETILLQTVAAWQATNNRSAMMQANKAMIKERERVEWNRGITLKSSSLGVSGGNSEASKVAAENEAAYRKAGVEGYNRRLTEIEAALKANELKDQLSMLKSRLEYQSLVVQLFFQRRFNLCIIASRLYGAVYPDGNRELQVGEETKNLFAKSSGMPPSLQTLEALSREIIADVEKGVKSARYLIGQNEIYSGHKRLQEAFLPGEYLPGVRTLSRAEKRRVLDFQRNQMKLIAALDVKDFDLADKLLVQIKEVASDYDDTTDRARIETAKSQSSFALAKAGAAALNGDKDTANQELEKAAVAWPRNPELQTATQRMLGMSGEQGKAIMELDTLLKQHDDRRIFDQKEKFIAAVAYAPEKKKDLESAILRVTEVEKTLEKASEMSKVGNAAGAWETLNAAGAGTEDQKLQTKLAQATTQCAEYVSLVEKAGQAAESGNLGTAMALYLQAKAKAPMANIPTVKLKEIGQKVLQDAKE